MHQSFGMESISDLLDRPMTSLSENPVELDYLFP